MAEKPKVVVLGEKPQGCQWLETVITSNLFNIVAGITRQDKSHVWWGGDRFSKLLQENQIPCTTRNALVDIDYDILFSFVYPFIIEQQWLDKAKLCINLHEAPLPRYRGCNGYSYCILESAETYGTTLHIMDGELDHGDIIRQATFPTDANETAKELYQRTIDYSTKMLIEALPAIAQQDFGTTVNDCENEPIHSRNSLDEMKMLSLDTVSSTDQLYQYTRALDFMPFEPAYYVYQQKKIYAYIDNSLGRSQLDIPHSIDTVDLTEKHLHEAAYRQAIKLTDTPRPIVLMAEDYYQSLFSIFR